MIPENWREIVVAEAKTWKNTPYVPKGRVKGVGTDCGGLIYEIYNPIFGPFAAMPMDYAPDWARHSDRERYLEFILPYVHEVEEPLPGDITLFHVGMAYAHAAIKVDSGNYIHAWGSHRHGSVIQNNTRTMMALAKKFEPKHFSPNLV